MSQLVENIYILNEKFIQVDIGKKKNLDWSGSLVRLSSYITCIARRNLAEIIYTIGPEKIYYCDTDSIYTTTDVKNFP